jgi:hypothetical protein
MQVHNCVKFVLPDLDTKRYYTLFIIGMKRFILFLLMQLLRLLTRWSVKTAHALDLLIWNLILFEGQIEMGYECSYLFV